MENTDKIKDMLTLIEKNNENYHEALNNLADTFNKSLSGNLRAAIRLERARNKPLYTGETHRTGFKHSKAILGRLFSLKR